MTNKCVFLLCLMLFSLFTGYSQTGLKEMDSLDVLQKQNEIKFNVSKSLVLKGIGMAYERILNAHNSLGLEAFVSLRNKDGFESVSGDYFDINRTFTLDAYYRRFFSKGYAKGFFLEGFSSFNQANEVEELFINETESSKIVNEASDLALGMALGGKFVVNNEIIIEVYYGLGANVLGKRDSEFTPRGGLSLGYRF